MSDPSAFADWLKQRRTQLGLTQDALARRVGCATITIQKLEAAALRPSVQIAQRLADQLEFTADKRPAFLASARRQPARQMMNRGKPDIPVPLTPLIGRDTLVAAVCATLHRRDVQILTLVGPPGVGKTRVALQVAQELASSFREQTTFIALAPTRDADSVIRRIAQALEVPEAAHQSALSQLIAVLRTSERLLVLDNFEHVVAAAPAVSVLLEAAPNLKVLITSRAALRISGEHLLAVPPLSLPDLTDLSPVEQLSQVPAVALFVQRVQAVVPAFALTATNAADVVAICRRLDGLPLALELAATRSTIFPPRALLARLQHPLSVLTIGARNLPTHQQTLKNTLTWSYDLLPDAAKILFARLGVFVGVFTLEAVTAICTNEAMPSINCLDSLELLMEQSLVQQEGWSDDEVRFRMLETIRDFARELLASSHEEATLRERHAGYYLSFVEQAETELHGPQQASWYKRLELEYENIRDALRWALDHDAAEVGLRLSGALWWFWPTYGFVREGAHWYSRLLPRIDSVEPALQIRVLLGAAGVAWYQGRMDQCATLAYTIITLNQHHTNLRDTAFAWVMLGATAAARGDQAKAAGHHQASRALLEAAHDPWAIAVALGSRGLSAFNLSQVDEATTCLSESFAYMTSINDLWGMMYVSTYLGLTLARQGKYECAEHVIIEGIQRILILGRRVSVPESFEGLAIIACARGDMEWAVQLSGVADSLRAVTGTAIAPAVQVLRQEYLSCARSQLDAAAFERAYERGRTMSLGQVIERALHHDDN